MSKNKKGEMTSKMLVSIILLMIGFVMILLLYSQFGGEQTIDREVCHNSVILRGTLPDTLGVKEYAPLKCKTNKFCITGKNMPLLEEKGNCEDDFGNVEGLTSVKVRDATQAERFISQEIIDCWSMMGEGKISIFGGVKEWLAKDYGLPGVYPSCVICSRIAFSNNLNEKIGEEELKRVNPLNYMMTHKIPNGDVSYYEHLVGDSPSKISIEGVGDSMILSKIVDDLKITDCNRFNDFESCIDNYDCSWSDGKCSFWNWWEGGNEIYLEDYVEDESSPPNEELAVVFMQISSPGHWDAPTNTLKAGLGGIAAGSILFGPKFLSGAGKLAINPWSWVVLAIAGVAQQGSVYHSRGLTAGYCGDISMGAEARNGCSVVRVVNYNVDDLRNYCAVIESIP